MKTIEKVTEAKVRAKDQPPYTRDWRECPRGFNLLDQFGDELKLHRLLPDKIRCQCSCFHPDEYDLEITVKAIPTVKEKPLDVLIDQLYEIAHCFDLSRNSIDRGSIILESIKKLKKFKDQSMMLVLPKFVKPTVISNQPTIKEIRDMEIGEVAYTLPWAYSTTDKVLSTRFPITSTKKGTSSMKIYRTGSLKFEISNEEEKQC